MKADTFIQERLREVLTLQEQSNSRTRQAIQFYVVCAHCGAHELKVVDGWQDTRPNISAHRYGCPVESAYVRSGKAVVNQEAIYELDRTRHGEGIDGLKCLVYIYALPDELVEVA